MILGELIVPARIRCGVEIAGWKEAIQLLAGSVAEDLGVASEPVRDALSAREKLGITAIGKGVGLPHARLELVEKPVGALLQLREPLGTATPDDVPVDLFICYLSPTVGADLAPLSRLVKHLRDDSFLNALRSAGTPAAVYALLKDRPIS